jgi:hypothetical protein
VRKGPPLARWVAGGAMVAAVSAALVVLVPMRSATPVVAMVADVSPVQTSTANGNVPSSDAAAFASVFTPTVDEEELI